MWEGLFYLTANSKGLTICGSGFSRGGGVLLTPPHELTCQNKPWGIRLSQIPDKILKRVKRIVELCGDVLRGMNMNSFLQVSMRMLATFSALWRLTLM